MCRTVLPILLAVVALLSSTAHSKSTSSKDHNRVDSIKHTSRDGTNHIITPVIVTIPGSMGKGQAEELVESLMKILQDRLGFSTPKANRTVIEEASKETWNKSDAVMKQIKNLMDKEKKEKEKVAVGIKEVGKLIEEAEKAAKQAEKVKKEKAQKDSKAKETDRSAKKPRPPTKKPFEPTKSHKHAERKKDSEEEKEKSPNPISGISKMLKEEAQKLKKIKPKKSADEKLKEMVQQLTKSLTVLVDIIDEVIETGNVPSSVIDQVDEVIPEALIAADKIAEGIGKH